MRDAFVDELSKLAAADPSVFLITGDLGFGVLEKFEEQFPDQFLNAGVAEQNMTMLAAGLALEGHKVFTYSIANFTILRPLEQIRNDICYHDADVTLVSVGGGFSYGQLGMSHFATEDLAILRSLPNMQVIAPADPWETRILMREMAARPGPKYLRLDKGRTGSPESPVEFGKMRKLRDGTDITLIGIGAILSEALAAAEMLAAQNIQARVLAAHSLKPFDGDAVVAAARETGGIVTIEEHNIIGGLGSAVAEVCMELGQPPRLFARIGLADIYPTVVGDQPYLRKAYAMDAQSIVRKVLGLQGK